VTKKVVGVFVRFSCAASMVLNIGSRNDASHFPDIIYPFFRKKQFK
jgi:hypothetical protein